MKHKSKNEVKNKKQCKRDRAWKELNEIGHKKWIRSRVNIKITKTQKSQNPNKEEK